RWCESMQYLMALASEHGEAMRFEELGHGAVLTKIAQTIQRQTPAAVLSAIIEHERQEAKAADTVAEAASARRQDPGDALGNPRTAGEKVAAWNGKYPIGTKVRSLIADYTSLQTRTQAMVLFGHRAAIYMKDYNGYFDLDEI